MVANLHHTLKPNGVFFGATILSHNPSSSLVTRAALAVYNRYRVFYNVEDKRDDLKGVLEKYFDDVDLKMYGIVAIWVCKNKKTIPH